MAGGPVDSVNDQERLAAHEVVRLRAPNAGPMTLSGTNTWVIGRDPAYVVDPGPADEAHVATLVELLLGRGGLGGIALTHDHGDHAGAVAPLRARLPAPVAAARGAGVGVGAGAAVGAGAGAGAGEVVADGASFGPLRVVATPGHSADHLAFVAGELCFTGDAVLGEGYVFLTPEPGALSGYLEGLARLRALTLVALLPGHGPPIWEPAAKLDDYIAHRLHRERLLLDALAGGARSVEELLDAAWADVPSHMRALA
ncbi:MAG: MBL fold metallo-hydrolase, partial [Solirubrobacterales bacterium]|nr:MBL fold metallo-hydrolase [Solirubrobacterales bacterium]